MKTQLLQMAGLLHFVILIASALVPRVLDWRRNLAALHPFLRKLFWVYGIFVVMVIVGFGALTLRHAAQMAAGTDPLARWLCSFIALFWFARLAVQFFVFDARPFLTNALLKTGYHALTLAFIFLVAIYGWAEKIEHAMNHPAFLTHALQAAAAGQLCVAVLNLFLVRILHWRDDLAKLPLLIREVFQIHVWFISITLTIFAVLTWRFAGVMSANPACRWLAGAIGIFWGIRTVLQVGYYSSSHWRGIPARTTVHVVLLVTYGCLTIVYGVVALGFFGG